MPLPRIVEAEWDDHAFYQGDSVGTAEDRTLAKQRTVGYFVYEDDKVLKIAQSCSDEHVWGEVLVIDKKMLVKRRFLTR